MMEALSVSAWAGIELAGDHLWQSTLVAIVVALLALVLRRNRAQVRHGLWLVASLKFLVPFAALTAIGRQFGWQSSDPTVTSDVLLVIDAVSQPFSQTSRTVVVPEAMPASGTSMLPFMLLLIWGCGLVMMLLHWFRERRRVAALVGSALPVTGGREVETLRRLEKTSGIFKPIAMVTTDTPFEPAVFGTLKPVLLWPRAISEDLDDDHVAAILAHELSHVRRRDNLVASVHTIIQAVFWFHPVVWWVGARLLDERERSCDLDVIESGNEPEVYAESILKTCRFYVGAPVTAMSGVTGSDLSKRIEAIMSPEAGRALDGWKKVLLATAAAVALAAPLVVGMLSAPRLVAQEKTGLSIAETDPSLEVASVKLNESREPFARLVVQPGGRYTATNVPLRTLIRSAYQLQDSQLIGGPDWIGSDRFDIVAKAEGDTPPTVSDGAPGPMQMMLRALLADRFNLKVHLERRELPVYALRLASRDGKLGAHLRPDADDPSIFVALQEQLGLKLETERAPVEVLVIDRVEPPTSD